jgi:hypothetical protein
MNNQTSIYLLFKEYVDQSRLPSHQYIHGDTFPLDSISFIEDEFYSVIDVLDFFHYERKNAYYDIDNFEGLLYQSALLPESYPNIEQTFLSQFAAFGVTERPLIDEQKNVSYKLYHNDVTSDMLGDMAWCQSKGISCVLVHHEAIDTIDNEVILQSSSHESILLPAMSDIPSLHKWLSAYRQPKRTYHYSDKHGDAYHEAKTITDHHGTHPAAQLLTNDAQTNQLLCCAVGKDKDSALWYYDENNGCFIYFENEGNTPQLGFHAYHLNVGDDNYENIDVNKLRQVQDNIPVDY